MDPGHQWFSRDEPEVQEELAAVKAHKEWSLQCSGSIGWKPQVPVAAPPVQPKEPLPTMTSMAEKEVMEKEAARFMNGKSSRGEWVLQNCTTGLQTQPVEDECSGKEATACPFVLRTSGEDTERPHTQTSLDSTDHLNSRGHCGER